MVGTRRVIILGASNAAIGISVAIESAWQAFGQPLEVMMAAGFGRSYGIRSWVLGRTQPGILDCQLWTDLQRRSPLPGTAVLTDVGNDLVYEVPVEQVGKWVEQSLRQLMPYAARFIVTELPIASIRKLTRLRFLLMRNLLFPKCRLDLRTAVARAIALNETVVDLAARFGAQVICPDENWYGFDPIHVRRRDRRKFWQEIFSHDSLTPCATPQLFSLAQRIYLRNLRPSQRRLFGWQHETDQPAGLLPDGTSVSLY